MIDEIVHRSPTVLAGLLFGDEKESSDTLQRRLFSEAFSNEGTQPFLPIICQGVTDEIGNYTKIVVHKKIAFGMNKKLQELKGANKPSDVET